MPARVFTVPDFDRFARKARIEDPALVATIQRAERGIVDADLGGGVVKLRIARPGQGRSGGFRTIVALVADARAFFLVGYAKSDLDNLGDATLLDVRRRAAALQSLSDAVLDRLVAEGTLREIER